MLARIVLWTIFQATLYGRYSRAYQQFGARTAPRGFSAAVLNPNLQQASRLYQSYQRNPPTGSAGGNSYLQYLLLRNQQARISRTFQSPSTNQEPAKNGMSYSWNTWSSWTSCSRSCDGGAKARVRSCRRMGKALKMSLFRESSNNKECIGDAREYLTCNAHPCNAAKPLDDRKYKPRAKQCASFDGSNYNGKRYEWEPYIRAGMDECRLYCMAKGHRMFMELAKQVIDGTPCGQSSATACWDGICQERKQQILRVKPRNKDETLNKEPRSEEKLVDTVISRTFTDREGLGLGYNLLFKIPLGAKDILVTEVGPSANYLALKVGDKYILNGAWRIATSGTFRGVGTTFRYDIGRGRRSQERIVATGPITSELNLMILYQDETPRILMNYTIALPARTQAHAPAVNAEQGRGYNALAAKHPMLRWMTNGMTDCTRLCDGGEQQLVFSCVTVLLDRTTQVVDTSKCDELPRPPIQKRMCNMQPCPPRWLVLPWKQCSQKCGTGGVQLRDIRCQKKMTLNGNIKMVNLPIRHCDVRSRPAIHRPCAVIPCAPEWTTKAWGECSVTCGTGARTRLVSCARENGVELHAKECSLLTRPVSRESCLRTPCTAFWVFSKWSECSSECGAGVKHRVVSCVDGVGAALPHNECTETTKPRATIGCSSKECQTTWLTSQWTKCSSVCGEGFQSRLVVCSQLSDGRFNEVTDNYCAGNAKPMSKQRCNAGPCNTLWLTSKWNECSVSCGVGMQRRRTTCFDRVSHNGGSCPSHTLPPEKRVCNRAPCFFRGIYTGQDKEAGVVGQSHGESKSHVASEFDKLRTTAKPKQSAPETTVSPTKVDTDSVAKVNDVSTVKPIGFGRMKTSGKEVVKSINSTPATTAEKTKQQQQQHTQQQSPTAEFSTLPQTTSTPATTKTTPPDAPQTAMSSRATTEGTTQKAEATTTATTTTTEAAATTTEATTTTTTTTTTEAAPTTTTASGSRCLDTRNAVYCRVIVRLRLCQYSLYRSRCCFSCTANTPR